MPSQPVSSAAPHTKQLTGAEIVWATLTGEGVRTVFGYPGGAILPSYDALRRDLHTIEGCCRQTSAWRGDTRWLRIGIMMGELHKKAGEWLRGYPIPGTFGRYYPSRRLFETLSANLTAIKREADNLRTKATGRVGLILPDVLPAPLRTEGRPMQVILPQDRAA